MNTEILVKAENLQSGMTYWDGTTITIESTTTHFVTLNFSDGNGMSVSRKVRKTSEIRVLEADLETLPSPVKVFIKSTNYGSDKYGNCECCNKHATEVFHTVALREYIDPDTNKSALTGFGMPFGKWGHLNCLNSFAATIIDSIGQGRGEIIHA